MARAKTPGNGNTGRKQVTSMAAPKPFEVKKNTSTVDLEEEGVLLRYRDDELVGITVLEASRQQ